MLEPREVAIIIIGVGRCRIVGIGEAGPPAGSIIVQTEDMAVRGNGSQPPRGIVGIGCRYSVVKEHVKAGDKNINRWKARNQSRED